MKQTQYAYLYVLDAVCPATRNSVGMRSPYLNTDTVNVFFEQFEKEVDPKVHVVMFWDEGGFHMAGHMRAPPNLTLIPLPPHSPELNPVENLWHSFAEPSLVQPGLRRLRQLAERCMRCLASLMHQSEAHPKRLPMQLSRRERDQTVMRIRYR